MIFGQKGQIRFRIRIWISGFQVQVLFQRYDLPTLYFFQIFNIFQEASTKDFQGPGENPLALQYKIFLLLFLIIMDIFSCHFLKVSGSD